MPIKQEMLVKTESEIKEWLAGYKVFNAGSVEKGSGISVWRQAYVETLRELKDIVNKGDGEGTIGSPTGFSQSSTSVSIEGKNLNLKLLLPNTKIKVSVVFSGPKEDVETAALVLTSLYFLPEDFVVDTGCHIFLYDQPVGTTVKDKPDAVSIKIHEDEENEEEGAMMVGEGDVDVVTGIKWADLKSKLRTPCMIITDNTGFFWEIVPSLKEKIVDEKLRQGFRQALLEMPDQHFHR